MFSESAELYDLIYASFKDYASEAAQVATMLRTVHPRCQTVLDVACGTGEHARLLASQHGFTVDGLDLDPAFVRIAQGKNPAGRFIVADMTDFQLPYRYDAVTCLFSSIGYLLTLERVKRALVCFGRHLAADGVLIVEPWFAPGVLETGHLSRHTGEAQGIKVERVGQTDIDGRVSRLSFDYKISNADGVREASEIHELGLFTQDEMVRAFETAGFVVQYDTRGLTGRGLYVARVAT